MTQPIVRLPLLTAHLANPKAIERVEVKRLEFSPGQETGLHLHPCPVVGLITAGTIVFQVEGQPQQTLRTGDAFFEPANTKILHFDAISGPATFVAFYLMTDQDRDVIKYL